MPRYTTQMFLSIALPFAMAAEAPSVAFADNTHPFSVHDMLAMQRISGAAVSSDGRRVVFAVRTTDLPANRGRTDLWLVNIDGTGLRQLTTHPASDSSPRWMPDGKSILFLSSRSVC